MAKPNIVYLSFKDNLEDKMLLDWLEDKFNQFGNKSNYIKYVLRKEMQQELEEKEK
ncbi:MULTISPECIES: hypothetical protein [Terrisporobacter]|uniref:hypothetical protein n=1 Tax=Terrisporobacter TaxID=1505652 RepID=UPI0023F19BC6|nr:MULTISPECIES: hypothetical protein [Terrisporobacter]